MTVTWWLATQLGPQPSPSPAPIVGDVPDTPGEALELIQTTLVGLWAGFLRNLPLFAIALLIVVVGGFASGYLARGTMRALRRTSADGMVVGLTARLVRIAVVIAFLLLALSVAGVSVGAALASLGIAGLALAFALQNILENFVAGILLLVRKPFRAGDQVKVAEREGTVDEIDLRVTRLVDYDGEVVLIPNADVFRSVLVNRTQRGTRRTVVTVGVDYRDDHDQAAQVILAAVSEVGGVLDSPAPEVHCTALGESSVDYDVRYWTSPRNADVQRIRDLVLRRVKTAIEAEGMTIPWPIRTVAFDDELRVRGGRS